MDIFYTKQPQFQGPISKRWLLAHQCGILTPVEPAVFLDRDNTLIANTGDLGEPSRVRLLDGVAPALVKLRNAGYRLIVVTNQGGVARGKFTEADVDAVHQRIAQLLADAHGRRNLIDRFYYCPYHPQGAIDEYRRDHSWRKPHPGMILQASRDMELDLRKSWLIGDHQRDVAAGRAAGCKTILVSKSARLAERANPTLAVDTFANAVEMILSNGEEVAEIETLTTVLTQTKEHSQESEISQVAEALSDSAETVETLQQEGATATQVLETTTVEAKPDVVEFNIETMEVETNWPFVESQQDEQDEDEIVAQATQPSTAPVMQASTVNDVASNEVEDSEATRAALSDVRRAILDLSDELRSDRVQRNELTPFKMAAGVIQMMVVLCVFFGLLHVSDPEAFNTVIKWILGGMLLQLITITLVLLEKRG